MNPTDALYATLRASQIDFFMSVPCKLLANLIDKLKADGSIFYTPVTREEEGIGLAFGAHLAGRRPALLMQNSGIGNSANAILSLLNYYQAPICLIVSHRGTEGEPIEAQRMMGNATKDLLDVLGVDYLNVDDPSQLKIVQPGIARARAAGRSIAILLPFSFWASDN
jgi:sulfopyruvate decarboxylase subunit alpha